jgi:hypothetical protein
MFSLPKIAAFMQHVNGPSFVLPANIASAPSMQQLRHQPQQQQQQQQSRQQQRVPEVQRMAPLSAHAASAASLPLSINTHHANDVAYEFDAASPVASSAPDAGSSAIRAAQYNQYHRGMHDGDGAGAPDDSLSALAASQQHQQQQQQRSFSQQRLAHVDVGNERIAMGDSPAKVRCLNGDYL